MGQQLSQTALQQGLNLAKHGDELGSAMLQEIAQELLSLEHRLAAMALRTDLGLCEALVASVL